MESAGSRANTRIIVLYGLFTAVVFLLGMTPLGFIHLPIASITTVHVPVIVGGYVLGRKGGSLLGFMFGLTSFIQCFMAPDATAAIVLGLSTGFGPYNLLLVAAIIFLPRVLAGLFSASVYSVIREDGRREMPAMGAAAFVGSMTNTIFYLGGLYILAFEQTAQAMGVAGEGLLKVLLGIVAANGLLEAVAAVAICTAVGKAVTTVLNRAGKGA